MSTLTTEKPADAILVIDARAKQYAAQRDVLSDHVNAFNFELEQLRRRWMPVIRKAAARCADLQDNLSYEIKGRPDLFVKPRTMTLHGIKLGFQKGKGAVEWDDTDKVVERIRAQFVRADAELLLDIKVTPRKAALLTLDVAALKKLGCRVVETGDAVTIKAANGDVEKLVAKILDEGTKTEGEE